MKKDVLLNVIRWFIWHLAYDVVKGIGIIFMITGASAHFYLAWIKEHGDYIICGGGLLLVIISFYLKGKAKVVQKIKAP